jgi:hypothetical protein
LIEGGQQRLPSTSFLQTNFTGIVSVTVDRSQYSEKRKSIRGGYILNLEDLPVRSLTSITKSVIDAHVLARLKQYTALAFVSHFQLQLKLLHFFLASP